jgi:tetratricopeptide (TPR) repeat protein
MSNFLTFVAVETTDLDRLLKLCVTAAPKIGLSFTVPKGPQADAHTWIGVFENGWTFALADPAVWELITLFSRVTKDAGLPCLTGQTAGEWSNWSYNYSEDGELLHSFHADPSRFKEHEYGKYKGDPGDLAELFGVSESRLKLQMRQFEAAPVQDFLLTLGFDPGQAKSLRFVAVSEAVERGPSAFSVGISPEIIAKVRAAQGQSGDMTTAIEAVLEAADEGLVRAAGVKAARFAAGLEYNEAHELFKRLRLQGRPEIALEVAEELVSRLTRGEFSFVSLDQAEMRTCTAHGLRGLALMDLKRYEEAIEEFAQHALNMNRYVGPHHRASIMNSLGTALAEMGRFQEAIEPLLRRLAERPVDAAAWANLGNCYYQTGKSEEARQAALQGLAADPDLPVLQTLKLALGLRDSDLLPPRDATRVRIYRDEAQELMRQGQKMQAVAKFRLSLHSDPTDVDAAWGVSCALVECVREGVLPIENVDADAIRLLEQVVFQNPTWPWSWGCLAEILLKRGDKKWAIDVCDAYAKHHVNRIEDLQDVGIWLATIDPDLGIRLLEIFLERFVDLRMSSMTGINRNQSKFRTLLTLGWSLMEVGRVQESLPILLEASQLDSGSAENWSNLATAHHRLGNTLAANKALSRGLRIDAAHPKLQALAAQLRGD